MHKLQIRNTSGEPSHGNNTQILLDGKPLEGVNSVSIKIEAMHMTEVTIVMCVDLDVDLKTEIEGLNRTAKLQAKTPHQHE